MRRSTVLLSTRVTSKSPCPREYRAITATSVETLSDQRYRIHFDTQDAVGEYTVSIGPLIEDTAGLKMDQDEDGTKGEDPDDTFQATFTIAEPCGEDV